MAGSILPDDHHALPDPGVFGQDGFYPPGLHAESADLHLMVESAEKLDIAVRKPSGQVAGFVQAGAVLRAEGMGDELFPRQLGAMEIALGQSRAGDVQLPRDSDGSGLTMMVQDIDPCVGDGAADGDPPLGFGVFID